MAKKKAADLSAKPKRAPRGSVAKPSKVDNAVVSGVDMTEGNKRTAGAPASKRVGLSSELIGHTAGELWRVLADRGGQPLSGIKKTIDAPDEVIMAAVGWLAREDKLAFETDGRTVTVSLL